VPSTSPPVRSAAATIASAKRAIASLTGTTSRGSAFSRESSLAGSKRVKRSCQSPRKRRASTTAARALRPGASPVTATPHLAPKQSNRSRASPIFRPLPPGAAPG
jgi:hypothetical protein